MQLGLPPPVTLGLCSEDTEFFPQPDWGGMVLEQAGREKEGGTWGPGGAALSSPRTPNLDRIRGAQKDRGPSGRAEGQDDAQAWPKLCLPTCHNS